MREFSFDLALGEKNTERRDAELGIAWVSFFFLSLRFVKGLAWWRSARGSLITVFIHAAAGL